MLKLKIRDVEINDDRYFAYCEDEQGDIYRFPLTHKKARMIALFLADAYVSQDNIYEFVINLLNDTNLYVDSFIINDGYNDRAAISINDNGNLKSFRISISDALILSLMLNASLYIDKKAEILLMDEMNNLIWYRFLKELDLCQ